MTLVYDHHTRDLSDKLTEHQHSYHQSIVSVLHIHLDTHNCLEVAVVRETSREVKKLAEELRDQGSQTRQTGHDHDRF